MSARRNLWVGLSFDAWALGLEAATVMALRTRKIAAGGAAGHAEAARMVSEKVSAGMALQMLAITGGLGTSPAGATARTLTHYRRKVRANRRRLST